MNTQDAAVSARDALDPSQAVLRAQLESARDYYAARKEQHRDLLAKLIDANAMGLAEAFADALAEEARAKDALERMGWAS
jgi:hypothetical protein